MNKNLIKYCPNCKRVDHVSEAQFCFTCGTKLVNEVTRQFYISLKVPEDKIEMEKNFAKTFMGFPFFLRKECNGDVEAITMHEYPQGKYSLHELSISNHSADKTEDILITTEIIDEFLSQGFRWYHHSEIDTLW